MLLAEIEIRHTRAIAPTRRVALGELWLPTDPPPGHGGLLLASIVAANMWGLDEELGEELDRLIDDLELGRRVPQPRLRHRFQTDTVGLDRSRHRLVRVGQAIGVEIDDHASSMPQVLGAVYAASRLSSRARPAVFRMLRRATRWVGDPDSRMIAYLSSDEAAPFRRWLPHDTRWACRVLGFDEESDPARTEVQRRFRDLVRRAHPDHGADTLGAGQRILELTEAKRILLAVADMAG